MAGIIFFKIIIAHLIRTIIINIVITTNIAIVDIQIRIQIAAIGLAHIEPNINMMRLIGN